MRPEVSVVVPGKDAGEFVSETLTSLTRQFDDLDRLEVVMVDDGSSDDTGDIARSYARKLPHLTVLRNDSAVGLAEARNQGLRAATGRFIAYLDADDWLAPRHLAQTAAALDALGCAFVRVDHTTVQDRKRALVRAPEPVRNRVIDPRDSIMPEGTSTMVDYPYAWAGMFDRALAQDGLLEFPKGLHTAEDRPWIWNLHLAGGSYAVVDAPGICYRRGLPGSLTQIYDRRQLDFIPALERAYDVLRDDKEPERFMPKFVRTTAALVAHHVSRSRDMEGDVRRDLMLGARRLVNGLPREMVVEQITHGPGKRRAIVSSLLRKGMPRDTVRAGVGA